jgi:hypothetical protein
VGCRGVSVVWGLLCALRSKAYSCDRRYQHRRLASQSSASPSAPQSIIRQVDIAPRSNGGRQADCTAHSVRRTLNQASDLLLLAESGLSYSRQSSDCSRSPYSYTGRDVQNDFLPPNGKLAVDKGRSILSPICELLDPTQDWPWAKVVASQVISISPSNPVHWHRTC